MFLAHLKNVNKLGAVTTHDEIDVREELADSGRSGDHKIDAFTVHQSG